MGSKESNAAENSKEHETSRFKKIYKLKIKIRENFSRNTDLFSLSKALKAGAIIPRASCKKIIKHCFLKELRMAKMKGIFFSSRSKKLN